jgi:hypothetical protein
VPFEYRKEIGKQYQWVTEGFHRYATHKATEAGLQLASEVLNYRATHGFTYQLEIQRYMTRLRDGGITAADVLIRVTEFVAHTEQRKFASQREEDFALARIVISLAPVRRGERRPTGRVLAVLGAMLRDACYLYAMRLAKKLREDAEERSKLRRRSGDFSSEA